MLFKDYVTIGIGLTFQCIQRMF